MLCTKCFNSVCAKTTKPRNTHYVAVSYNKYAYNVLANLRNEAGTVGIKNIKQVPYKLFFLEAGKCGHQLDEKHRHGKFVTFNEFMNRIFGFHVTSTNSPNDKKSSDSEPNHS